jgi:L-asparaginase
MKQIKKLGLVVVTLLLSATMAFAAKPNIHILATGGTIAGTGSSATGKLLSVHCWMQSPKSKISPM